MVGMTARTHREAPITLRSAGVPEHVAPVRRLARATYKVVAAGRSFVEVVYDAPGLWSGLRVEVRDPRVTATGVDPLYEASYLAAARAAAAHGFELDRFTLVTT